MTIANVPEQTVIEGYHARMVHSERMTFVYWRIEPNILLPEHHHPHEQVTHILEGSFHLVVNGVTHKLHAGDCFVIPPNAVHSGFAPVPCRLLDVFAPVREDYLATWSRPQ
jgi:quercetin dioxygenase-like cupin family protein